MVSWKGVCIYDADFIYVRSQHYWFSGLLLIEWQSGASEVFKPIAYRGNAKQNQMEYSRQPGENRSKLLVVFFVVLLRCRKGKERWDAEKVCIIWSLKTSALCWEQPRWLSTIPKYEDFLSLSGVIFLLENSHYQVRLLCSFVNQTCGAFFVSDYTQV